MTLRMRDRCHPALTYLSSRRRKLGTLNAIASTFCIWGGEVARGAGTSETVVDFLALRDGDGVGEWNVFAWGDASAEFAEEFSSVS